jgi:hypothetical protein
VWYCDETDVLCVESADAAYERGGTADASDSCVSHGVLQMSVAFFM